MNEPKKSLIEAAARKLWRNLQVIHINQRKHTLRVTMPLVADGNLCVRPFHVIESPSHRELLNELQGLAVA